jgi:predicted  nucleic acid-binding Zn-ribbon protein
MASVSETTGVLPGMDARMAAIEEAMPVLVEVQRHLSDLPETMTRLEERIAGLSDLLERLDRSVASLNEALKPIGRIADRLPGRKG